MKRRKTIGIEWLINAANARMIATKDAEARKAIFYLTEAALMETGNYAGFWYAHVAPDDSLHHCRPAQETPEQTADPNYVRRDDPAYRSWVDHASNGHLMLLFGGDEYHATGEDFWEYAPGWTADHKWVTPPDWHRHRWLAGRCSDSRCAERDPNWEDDAPIGAGEAVEASRG